MKPWRIILLAACLALGVWGMMIGLAHWRGAEGPQLTLDLGKGAKLELLRIEPGEFVMGSAENEEGHDPSEAPQTRIRITRPFYLGKFEITQQQYEAVMGFNQASFKGEPQRAVDCIGYVDAQKFCKYASQRTGRVFRLPSEAEWEYACRAGGSTAYNGGEKLTPQDAVFNWSKADGTAGKPDRPALVGSCKPNAWGLYDMEGNLWEWCEDVFAEDLTHRPATQGAAGAGTSTDVSYVYRGGSWRSGPEECRAAVRFAGAGELRSDVMGFRVVVEPR